MKRKKGDAASDTLQVVLNRLQQYEGMLAYDSETSGLSWRANHVVGHVVTFSPKPVDSYYIPFRHGGGANVGGAAGPQTTEGWDGKLAKGEKELLDLIFRKGRRIVGHNLSFDLKFAYRLIGEQAFEPQFEDTMINEPLLNEFAGKFSLEACAIRHGVQAKKGEAMVAYLRQKFPEIKSDREAMGHYWRLAGDDAMGVEYATGDGTSTWQLRDAQMVEMAKNVTQFSKKYNREVEIVPSLMKVHDVESRLIRVLARMTCRGIKVDMDKALALEKVLDDQISEMMKIFPDPENASVQGATDVKWWMEKHGHTDWPMTPKTNKPSFPESYLEKHEAGRKLIEIRRITHMRNSFIRPLIHEHVSNVSGTWRAHANFNQLRNDEYGTITGRLSCDSPNLQQAHKRDAVRGRMLRGLFVPDTGKIFADVDYSQIEPRILAHFSGCKVLLDGYRAVPSVDAHLAVAKAIAGPRWESMTDEERKYARQNGKRVNQTIASAGGKGVLVAKYDVDPKEVDKIFNDYFRTMPEIKKLQKDAARAMESRGFVRSILGRRSRLRDLNKSYVAINRILQCNNADLIKERMVAIDDYLETVGRPVDVLLNVHDSLLFQFDEEHRDVYNRCLEIMQDVTTGPIQLDVPAEVESGEGTDWAVATFG